VLRDELMECEIYRDEELVKATKGISRDYVVRHIVKPIGNTFRLLWARTMRLWCMQLLPRIEILAVRRLQSLDVSESRPRAILCMDHNELAIPRE
jgi:hypothetical protein